MTVSPSTRDDAAPERDAEGRPRSLARGWDARDVAIVAMLARNTGRAEIARQLGCSPATVDRRTSALRRQLEVRTTIEVVVHAVRMGVV